MLLLFFLPLISSYGCLPPVIFLPHCHLFRPHPYLSIVALVMVTVTCWLCCLNTLCHTAAFAVVCCKVHGWPALLDFQTLKGSGSGLTEGLLGKLWIVFKKKKDACTCTHVGTHSFSFFFLKGPLCASLSFPPTHSPLLTLSVAETTCVLSSWIFRARVFSVFSRHFSVVGVTVVHVYWDSLVRKILLHSLIHFLWSHIALTQRSAVYQKEISHCVGHRSPWALLLKAALLTFWRSIAKASPGRVFLPVADEMVPTFGVQLPM